MIPRDIASKIRDLARVFPIISVTGPRQSGKTTLVQALFPDYSYINLENMNERLAAEEDPIRFLSSHSTSGVILDEIQKVPILFSYLQGIVDSSGELGKFILTGSQNFLLMEGVTQSLAGRVALCQLLPFSQHELTAAALFPTTLDISLLSGGYPVLYDRKIRPGDYFPSYIQTYIERDVRTMKNIGDLSLFQRFVRLCAGRVGQLLNLSNIGNELGINYKTVRSWISILEASHIVFLLQPYHRNFNKRIVKMPKLYFYDTGLLCALLGIAEIQQLDTHFCRGSIFESYVISEYLKHCFNSGVQPNAFFWRNSTGHEIDLIIENAGRINAVEIKSGETITGEFFKGLKYFRSLGSLDEDQIFLVYGGEQIQSRIHGQVFGWEHLDKLFRQ